MRTFMIRESALKQGQFYIDFGGEFEVSNISAVTGITENNIDQIYERNGGVYNSEKNVYYFSHRGNAADAVNDLRSLLRPARMGRTVELTEEEIEYIRRALINEDSNIIYTKSKIRDAIFDKLNR